MSRGHTNPRLWVRLLLVLCLVVPVCASAGERGLLWQVTPPAGPTSYLFGTIHTHDARVTTFSPRLLQAIAAADVFMPEATPPESPAMLFMPSGTLKTLLTEEETSALLQLADTYALRDSVALRMKPWLLAVILSQPDASGMPPQDLQLMEIASSKGKVVEALEDAQAHFGAMDGLEMSEQLVLLRAAMKQSQQEKEQAFESLVAAYQRRDAEAIANLDERLSADDLPPALWEKIRSILIVQRNAAMVQRLIQQMPKRSVFVAVGTAHLPGADGLIMQLRQAGFVVEALE